MQKQALQEGVKEFGRIIVIAILPVLIDSLTVGEFSWRATGVAILVAALKAADKYVHKNESIDAKGILPF